MKNRIPGLIMLLFLIAGTAAGIRYGGTDLPSTIRGIVGALSGLGLFWILARIYFRRPKQSC